MTLLILGLVGFGAGWAFTTLVLGATLALTGRRHERKK
jgi:hypothetical protein